MKVSKIHHLLAFASLMYGESATMASESAMLGVPSIFHDNDGRGYTDEQQKKYGLVFNYSESKQISQRHYKKQFKYLKSRKVALLLKKREKNCLTTPLM